MSKSVEEVREEIKALAVQIPQPTLGEELLRTLKHEVVLDLRVHLLRTQASLLKAQSAVHQMLDYLKEIEPLADGNKNKNDS